MDKSSSGTSPIRRRLHYFSLFVPVRLYLLLFAAGISLGIFWLNNHHTGIVSSYDVVLTLLIKMMLSFGVLILSLSFVSALVPWIVFMVSKISGNVKVKLEMGAKEMDENAKQAVRIDISPLLSPLFGFLRFRLVYDGKKLSPKFSVVGRKRKIHLFSFKKGGLYNWPLPEIKEYHVEKLVVYFEDIFQFFSLSTAVRVSDNFFTRPGNKEVKELNVSPKKTEEENTRIEELRRVDGEYLNYKNFENNDDVRRIVWKVYAKNKELVVRTQEIMDPSASHVYLYATYYDGLEVAKQPIVFQNGLNYFKTAVWSVYSRLKKQGFEVRFLPDQESKQVADSDTDQKALFSITLGNWHKNDNIAEYVNSQIASVVCMSSLVPIEKVNLLVDSLSKDTTIVYIKLSNSFRKHGVFKWLRWLFLQEENDEDNRHLVRWNLSQSRRKLLRNERAIADLLKKTDVKVTII